MTASHENIPLIGFDEENGEKFIALQKRTEFFVSFHSKDFDRDPWNDYMPIFSLKNFKKFLKEEKIVGATIFSNHVDGFDELDEGVSYYYFNSEEDRTKFIVKWS